MNKLLSSKMMKFLISFLFFLINVNFNVCAQNIHSQTTQVEIGAGFVLPFFNKGEELISAKAIRNQQQSYYVDGAGNRTSVGNYSRSSGFNFSVGFYKPIKKVNGLMVGALVRNSQTGSTPAQGGYEEAYFFNFITASAAVKYYPFENNNLFVKTDLGLAAVLTKNRYLNSQNEQNFFHQFGIGNALAFEIGYGLTPFKNKSKSLEFKTGYQLANTRVEVNGIGDDHWQFGALFFGTSLNF